ncbi:MAG: orotidine-5'-phosphate decarboxylase [Candidatus Alcyoniella australis]|nr:orotidine-5'-phosphate decarboxylase [Candidatus Alcyoniella australis]
MEPRDRLFVALDFNIIDEVLQMAQTLRQSVGGYKVGLAAFTAGGPDLVRRVLENGLPVFLDLKLHDIPNTVAGASREIGRMGVAYTTVHTMGGAQMVKAAAEGAAQGAQEAGFASPKILAVTVLTSMSATDLMRIGMLTPTEREAGLLATLAAESGAHGVVCSAWEVRDVRRAVGPDIEIVTPGIRPTGADQGDQKRVATPATAIRRGTDLMVVGRPITRAADPAAAANAIVDEIKAALAKPAE